MAQTSYFKKMGPLAPQLEAQEHGSSGKVSLSVHGHLKSTDLNPIEPLEIQT